MPAGCPSRTLRRRSSNRSAEVSGARFKRCVRIFSGRFVAGNACRNRTCCEPCFPEATSHEWTSWPNRASIRFVLPMTGGRWCLGTGYRGTIEQTERTRIKHSREDANVSSSFEHPPRRPSKPTSSMPSPQRGPEPPPSNSSKGRAQRVRKNLAPRAGAGVVGVAALAGRVLGARHGQLGDAADCGVSRRGPRQPHCRGAAALAAVAGTCCRSSSACGW